MKSLIVNHLFDSLNKEIDADWWAKYLDLLIEFAEERAQQEQDSSSDSAEDSQDESIDDSLKPLISELKSIFESINNNILENNNKILKDILGAAAQGMDRKVLEEIIESVRSEAQLSNTETAESLETLKESLPDSETAAGSTKSVERSVVETLKESLPEDHTIPRTETVEVLRAVQEKREENENN
ncbi:hypothetical protein [Bacillus haynesii]|uniref:hypothetical protein n=1 Tax=Bacillus haynesii TaxID=1925021 RepID=UPI0003ED9AA4|nr:hypothetical protein [Bacillus haynesii]EWH21458.1 hypothetical protein M769_0114480 [Bacillus haynesii]